MNSINDFLIQVDSQYEDKASIGGKEIMLTSIFEDAYQLNKSAKVVGVPMESNGIKAEKDDYIFFSHLILREAFDGEGNIVPNNYLVDANKKIYRVPARLVYAYTHDDELHIPSPFFICEPIISEEQVTPAGIIIPDSKKEIKHVGRIAYSNPIMKEKGFNPGDIIFFSKDSEYEMKIFGKRYYRMKHDWIIGRYEC